MRQKESVYIYLVYQLLNKFLDKDEICPASYLEHVTACHFEAHKTLHNRPVAETDVS